MSNCPRILMVREFERLNLRCRARIRIGSRSYFGLVSNISEGGAQIVTETPIRNEGAVRIQLPDLAPLVGELRWSSGCKAGIRFCLKLDRETLDRWREARTLRAA